MLRKQMATIAILPGLILFFAPPAICSGECQNQESVALGKVDFHYVIFGNVVRDFGSPDATVRSIDVLMDENEFSEAGIKKLFQVLSKGYPQPMSLHVYVVTNLGQTHNPGRPRSSAEPEVPADYEHHWAGYSRGAKEEFFRYNPNPPGREIKTVSLKRGSQ